MRLDGVWVPTVTPLHDGALDLESLRRLVGHLLDLGVTGIVAGGSTGEGAMLEPDELAEVVATVTGLAGEQTIAGVVATSTTDACRRAMLAAQAGARAVLVLVPGLVGALPDELAAHLSVVAAATPVPILAYEFPGRTGVRLGTDVLLRLADAGRLVGTKQSVALLDAELTRLIVDAPESFAVLVGNARLFWPARALGAAGGILAAAHLEAGPLVEIDRLAREGDLAAAAQANRKLWPRLAAVESVVALKRELRDRGLIASAEARPPLGAGAPA